MVIIHPSPNAPIVRKCDVPGCTATHAVADAKTKFGPWGYLCKAHLETIGTRSPAFITNITLIPLELEWIDE